MSNSNFVNITPSDALIVSDSDYTFIHKYRFDALLNVFPKRTEENLKRSLYNGELIVLTPSEADEEIYDYLNENMEELYSSDFLNTLLPYYSVEKIEDLDAYLLQKLMFSSVAISREYFRLYIKFRGRAYFLSYNNEEYNHNGYCIYEAKKEVILKSKCEELKRDE